MLQGFRAEIRQTLALGIPMAGAQLSQLAMTTISVGLVGRLPGNGLASMAVGNAVYSLFLVFGIGLVAAVNPLVSQAHGARRPDEATRALGIGVGCALVYGLLAQLCLYHVDLLYAYLGYSSEVTKFATEFVRTLMIGLPGFLSFLAFKYYLDSTSRPKFAFVVAFGAIGLNALLGYLLVLGRWGVPSLGVMGAGLSTSSVNIIMAFALYYGVRKELPPGFLRHGVADVREFLALGLPVAGTLLMEVGLFAVCALLMGHLGANEAAAHQIVATCSSTTFMIPLGISFAGATRVGQAVGARQLSRVRPAGLAAVSVGVASMLVSGFVFLTFPGVLVKILWNPDDGGGAVSSLAMELFAIAAVFQLFDGLQATSSGALRGVKDVKVPMLIGFVSYWMVGLVVATWLGLFTPLRHRGVWLGLLSGLAFAGITLFVRFLVISKRFSTQSKPEGSRDESDVGGTFP